MNNNILWPGLNYATGRGLLILYPSTPAVPPASEHSVLVSQGPFLASQRPVSGLSAPGWTLGITNGPLRLWRGGYIKAASYEKHELELVIKEWDDLFQRVLELRIIEAADENTKNNDMRSDRYLYRARVAIFVVLGLTAITGVTYVLDQVRY